MLSFLGTHKEILCLKIPIMVAKPPASHHLETCEALPVLAPNQNNVITMGTFLRAKAA
jgi:hypothetical protein